MNSSQNLATQIHPANNDAKAAILARVRESMAKNPHIPSYEAHFSSALHLTQQDLLQEFITNHSNNKSIVLLTDSASLPNTLNQILLDNITDDNRVLYNTDISPSIATTLANIQGITPIPYTRSVDEMRKELFEIPTSIVQARCGVADLGIIGLSSNDSAPRLSSLITNTCIYLLKKESIVQNLFNGITFIKEYEQSRSNSNVLPSNIIFVAGPSRTADIELQTVFGVHGPRKTYTLLY